MDVFNLFGIFSNPQIRLVVPFVAAKDTPTFEKKNEIYKVFQKLIFFVKYTTKSALKNIISKKEKVIRHFEDEKKEMTKKWRRRSRTIFGIIKQTKKNIERKKDKKDCTSKKNYKFSMEKQIQTKETKILTEKFEQKQNSKKARNQKWMKETRIKLK